MKPLQSVAMGLVVVVLSARFHGYDALADPVGWLLVLVGVRAFPAGIEHRRNLLRLASLAGLVAVVVWFPVVTEDLYDADASLGWVVNLPQLFFSALLCHVLAHRAEAAGDTRAARWLGITRTAVVVVGLLPVLVFGAGLAVVRGDVLPGCRHGRDPADLAAVRLRVPALGDGGTGPRPREPAAGSVAAARRHARPATTTGGRPSRRRDGPCRLRGLPAGPAAAALLVLLGAAVVRPGSR